MCCLLHGCKGPFHLTWLCKRFSQRPKGGECQALDKVPCLPDGPSQRKGERGRRVEWESSRRECLLNTRGRVVCEEGRVGECMCVPVPVHPLLPLVLSSSLCQLIRAESRIVPAFKIIHPYQPAFRKYFNTSAKVYHVKSKQHLSNHCLWLLQAAK